MELTNLTIMNALCDYRGICAKASMLTLLMKENTEYACFERDALEKEYCNLVFMKGFIECWLELLPDDERFLVQKHLIQGLDWAKVIVEYNERWGIMNGRAERTLKRIQARAIKRILNCMCEIDALKSTPDNNAADDIPADA